MSAIMPSLCQSKTWSSLLSTFLARAGRYSCNVCAIYKSAFAYFDRDNVALPGIAMFFKVCARRPQLHRRAPSPGSPGYISVSELLGEFSSSLSSQCSKSFT